MQQEQSEIIGEDRNLQYQRRQWQAAGTAALAGRGFSRYRCPARVEGVAGKISRKRYPRPGPKFDYKLQWFDRLIDHAAELLESGLPVILIGDFNVMPTERDVYKPERWQEDALFAPEVRKAFFRLIGQGWIDALRTLHPDETIHTFWNYFRNAFPRKAGLRIDHILLSLVLADRLIDAQVDAHVRGWEKTSDHAPVWIELADKSRRKRRIK